MRSSFFLRLTAIVVGLLIVTMLLASVAVLFSINRSVHAQARSSLHVGQRVFENALEQRQHELEQRVSILAADFGFKQAVATGDLETQQSALINHAERIGADLVMLADIHGKLIISSHHEPGDAQVFPLNGLLNSASEQGVASGVVLIDQQAYQAVLVPVRAPLPVAYVSMGFLIDEALATRISRLIDQQVSFFSASGGEFRLLSSTLGADARENLQSSIADVFQTRAGKALQLELDGIYLNQAQLVGQLDGRAVYAMIHVSLEAAFQAYRGLQLQMALIALGALLISAVSAALITRSITRPIEVLRKASERISRGDYSQPIVLHSTDEMGVLAKNFDAMREAVAQREEDIVYHAQHDTLTGLPNRALLNDRVETAMVRAQRQNTSLAIVDLDVVRFKDINDRMGQQAGDIVLIEMAHRMKKVLRQSDTILRLGGDEFLLILESMESDALLHKVQDLLVALKEDIRVGELVLRLNFTAGICIHPAHGDTAADLLRRANIAASQAKELGEDLHLYEEGEDEEHLRQIRIGSILPDAIIADELFMTYQPKVNAQTGEVTHAEALVRWIHPELGFISPEEFIRIAEQTGNIRLLTHWVMRTVIGQKARWNDEGIRINVAINLSALDLLDPGLPRVIAHYLEREHIRPQELTLEVTESALMEDPELAIRVLGELRDSGLSISIDDFGTGYSSLSQIKRLPAHELKIDKSFILKLEEGTEDAAIVRSTIELGHNLGLKVIAEGVENDVAWDLLKSYGCDYIQGYLISKPLESKDFTAWFHASSSKQ